MDTDPQFLRQLRQTKPPPAYARPVVGSAFFTLYFALLFSFFPMVFCFLIAFVSTITEGNNNYFIWGGSYFICFLLLISLPLFWLAKRRQWQYLLKHGKVLKGEVIDSWSDYSSRKKTTYYSTIRYMSEEMTKWHYMVVETDAVINSRSDSTYIYNPTIFYLPFPPYPAGLVWSHPFTDDKKLIEIRVKKPTQTVMWRSYFDTNIGWLPWFLGAIISSFYPTEGEIIDKWLEYYNQEIHYYLTITFLPLGQ